MVTLVVLVAACATVAPAAPATSSAGAAPALPTPVVGVTPRAGSPAAQESSRSRWQWTTGTVQLVRPAAISGIWPIGDAVLAVAVRDESDDDERDRAAFLRSEDGVAWLPMEFPVDPWFFEHGAVEDGVLTVFGTSGPPGAARREAWQTSDGASWTDLEATGLDFGPGWVRSLARGGDGWLLVGDQLIDAETHRSHLLYSSDLRDWEERPWPVGAGGPVVSDGHRFLAGAQRVVDNGSHPMSVAYSDDGATWSSADVAELPEWHSVSSIGGIGGGFALGGQRFEPADESSNPIAWWSADGVAWTEATVDGLPGPPGQAGLFDISSSADGLVATGNGDPLEVAIWLSDVGRTWTQVTPLPEGLNQLDGVARVGEDLIVSGRVGDGDHYAIWRGSVSR